MKTVYSPAHLAHAPPEEFEGGRLTPAVEVPERAERVRTRIAERNLGPIVSPECFSDDAILRVHEKDLVIFLGEAHEIWTRRHGGRSLSAIPSAWPSRGMRTRFAGDIESRLGSFAFDTATPIVKGTWNAAREAANVVLTASRLVKGGERAAFALTRPPGHHASQDVFGGYCYLNNIAIAAQWFVDQGLTPAILDVDYHHGNGTQAIFYRRADVFFVSLHADPAFAYPHFLGFADENGEGAGEGANLNLPLPRGTGWSTYCEALTHGIARVNTFAPDVLLVSLGLDTFDGDPISRFKLHTPDYSRMGEMIGAMRLPTLFVLEGGYNLDALAEITVNVLEGFESV